MTYTEKIEYIVGNSKFDTKPDEPYNKNVCQFISDLSKNLINNLEAKKYPDILTFAFWCRERNILKFKSKLDSNSSRLGLGLLFHVTPSNIPTNFAYSLIFGLTTGNSNIIKVPTNQFRQTQIICRVITKTLANKKYNKIKNKITIVRYKKENDDFTKRISLLCNARIIWGGDKSISSIRKFPINQRAFELTFADRYSFCIINSIKIVKLNKFEIKNLTRNFFNDTYLVDQNACSSPHLVIWLGNKSANKRAKEIFWKELSVLVKAKYELSYHASTEKYNLLCSNIIKFNNLLSNETFDNKLIRVTLKNLSNDNHFIRGKWGLFYEFNVKKLPNIDKSIINTRYQTLTYYGVDKNKLNNFVIKNSLKGIDRVVPIGQALDMTFIWDGYDINRLLSREIEIR